jgi:HEAT repeat protein
MMDTFKALVQTLKADDDRAARADAAFKLAIPLDQDAVEPFIQALHDVRRSDSCAMRVPWNGLPNA